MIFAGVIETLGESVKQFEVGDHVFGLDRFGFGSYAESKCIKANSLITLASSNLTLIESPSIPYGALLALSFLKRLSIKKDPSILIYGASGSVGIAAIQLARHFGAKVTAVCSTSKMELVKLAGADFVVDYTKDDFTKTGMLYDFVFASVPRYPQGRDRKSKAECCVALKPKGVYVGVDEGSAVLSLDDLNFVKGLAEAEELKPAIDCIYPMEDIAAAHGYVDQGHKNGSVIISPMGKN